MMKRFTPLALTLLIALPGVLNAQKEPAATQPAAKPDGAVMLFDGTQDSLTKNWTNRKGKDPDWIVADGEMTSKKLDIVSKEKYQDFQLHVEFCEPKLGPEVKGQERGNSGVYLQGRYEIQVLDSYGLPPSKVDCGAIYDRKAPDVNACLAPGEWQTYDITFTAPKFDADGKKTANARVTILQNGKKIQDDAEIAGTTGDALSKESAKPGPVRLQYHGNSVKFRNVWIVPGK